MKMRKTKLAKSALSKTEDRIWSAKDMVKAKRFTQLPVAMQEGLKSLKRPGRPRKAAPKKQITFRLEASLVDHLRSHSGYNAQIETMLLKAWGEKRI